MAGPGCRPCPLAPLPVQHLGGVQGHCPGDEAALLTAELVIDYSIVCHILCLPFGLWRGVDALRCDTLGILWQSKEDPERGGQGARVWAPICPSPPGTLGVRGLPVTGTLAPHSSEHSAGKYCQHPEKACGPLVQVQM